MDWVITKNNKPIELNDIPSLTIGQLREEIIVLSKQGKRVISFFGVNKSNPTLYVIMADDQDGQLYLSSAYFEGKNSYKSITPEVAAFHMFEREFYEEFGIKPEGHPWLKPVRYAFDRHTQDQTLGNYPFFSEKGQEIHEVGVGPIHAGIIEPGHFRFMCHGEDVHHLEIQLGYQHRGVENLFLQGNILNKHHLAESISGDTVIGYNTAYSNAIESLLDLDISYRAVQIRAIALEIERIAIHIGDLGAICGDIAYYMANSLFGATRTRVINTLLAICGSRFGKGLIRSGGVNFDINNELNKEIQNTLNIVSKDIDLLAEKVFNSASVLSRLEKTGILAKYDAQAIGMVGMAVRASNIALDVRADHPYGVYENNSIQKIIQVGQDVLARSYQRYQEIKQSISFILEQLQELKNGELMIKPQNSIAANKIVVSMVEGWRGEIVHTAITDTNGNLSKYKIKDPSFNNWYGLALAIRGNGISDFPVCNKSFDLSYCGNDL